MGNIFTIIIQGFISWLSTYTSVMTESCVRPLLPLHVIYSVLCDSHDQKLAYNPHIQGLMKKQMPPVQELNFTCDHLTDRLSIHLNYSLTSQSANKMSLITLPHHYRLYSEWECQRIKFYESLREAGQHPPQSCSFQSIVSIGVLSQKPWCKCTKCLRILGEILQKLDGEMNLREKFNELTPFIRRFISCWLTLRADWHWEAAFLSHETLVLIHWASNCHYEETIHLQQEDHSSLYCL